LIKDKNLIRQAMINQCIGKFDKTYYNDVANRICAHAKVLIDKSSSTVAIYHARQWEASLEALINYAHNRYKKLYHPVAYKSSLVMQFEQYAQFDKRVPIFAPLNYVPQNVVPWYNLDLIFIPLIAVDKTGTRLGSGGGYYDTTLAEIRNIPSGNKKPILCGVGFSYQLVDSLPKDSWDIPLDYFVSENGLYKFE
jgi:5-formyltetrahydrofolate cyclo-ligase